MNLRSGRRRNPFGVGIGWLAAWRDTLCCLMTATVVVEHRHRGGDRAQAQDGDYPHGLAPNRHWSLSNLLLARCGKNSCSLLDVAVTWVENVSAGARPRSSA